MIRTAAALLVSMALGACATGQAPPTAKATTMPCSAPAVATGSHIIQHDKCVPTDESDAERARHQAEILQQERTRIDVQRTAPHN